MCIQLAEGSCVALEVKAIDPKINVVSEFRKLCGPRDPVIIIGDSLTLRFTSRLSLLRLVTKRAMAFLYRTLKKGSRSQGPMS